MPVQSRLQLASLSRPRPSQCFLSSPSALPSNSVHHALIRAVVVFRHFPILSTEKRLEWSRKLRHSEVHQAPFAQHIFLFHVNLQQGACRSLHILLICYPLHTGHLTLTGSKFSSSASFTPLSTGNVFSPFFHARNSSSLTPRMLAH